MLVRIYFTFLDGAEYPVPDFPPGGTEELFEILKTKVVYWEVELHDWLVRVDIDGDGLLMKTVHQKGKGYDRPYEIDEINFNMKIYQGEKIIFDKDDIKIICSNEEYLSNTIRKILKSMKKKEYNSTIIKKEFILEEDPEILERFPGIDKDQDLEIDMTLHSVVKVDNWYKDGYVISKRLKKGVGSGSPYLDGIVACK
jgi:hypothetical protein